MTEALIVSAVRSAVGRRNGSLAHIRPDEALARVLSAAVERISLDPSLVEDVVTGCVTQVNEQGSNIGRLAPLIAGFPVDVPGVSVNRMCGSGQQAFNFACMEVISGQADIAIGCGVESMSRVPMLSDATLPSTELSDRHEIVHQGLSAEMIAERWGLTRTQVDEFSLQSHQRAAHAQAAGYFDREITPLTVPGANGSSIVFSRDEGIRATTSMEKLSSLQPAFKEDGVVTAGNASQISDGAAVLVVASREKAEQLGLTPRARFVASSLSGVDPTIMLTGPIPATRKILAKTGLSLDQMDVIEINEAFAPVVLAWAHEMHPDMRKVNPNGGAIALGHPLGATGARLIISALHELERTGGRYALITMCIGYGMGIATIIERLG